MKSQLAALKQSGLVYSTDKGRLCPECEEPIDECRCEEIRRQQVPEGDGVVRVSRETKGRKGKGVTLVKGVLLPEDELKKLAKQLKQKCGTGGAVKQGVIEIQGDMRELLVKELSAMGYQVKKAGG